MDDSVKTQQLLISYAMQKGGWRNMPLPSDWTQITTNNAIFYINKTGHTLLDVHPFKYLALGNEKEKKLVKKTIAHQYDPKKKNQNYISCWATCPLPEPHWIKLYHISKNQIIYYHQPTNTLTAKHPCRIMKSKVSKPVSKPLSKPININTKPIIKHKSKRKNARKRATSATKAPKIVEPIAPLNIDITDNSPMVLDLDAFIENDLQNIKYNKTPKQKPKPSTPPPRSSKHLDKGFNIISTNGKRKKVLKNRRTRSSFDYYHRENSKRAKAAKTKAKATKSLSNLSKKLSQNVSPVRYKRQRSLSNKFVTNKMDQNNNILNGYKSYTTSITKSVYMYAASRGNNVLFPIQNKNRKQKKNRSNSLSSKSAKKSVPTHTHSQSHGRKRRRNAVEMSSQIKDISQLLNKSPKLPQSTSLDTPKKWELAKAGELKKDIDATSDVSDESNSLSDYSDNDSDSSSDSSSVSSVSSDSDSDNIRTSDLTSDSDSESSNNTNDIQTNLYNNMANNMANMMKMMKNFTNNNSNSGGSNEFMILMNDFNKVKPNPIMLSNSYADDTSCSASDNDADIPTKSV